MVERLGALRQLRCKPVPKRPHTYSFGRSGRPQRPFRAKATVTASEGRIARKPAPPLGFANFIHSPWQCQNDHLPIDRA